MRLCAATCLQLSSKSLDVLHATGIVRPVPLCDTFVKSVRLSKTETLHAAILHNETCTDRNMYNLDQEMHVGARRCALFLL